MNNNFKRSLALYNYIVEYKGAGYTANEIVKEYAPFAANVADELVPSGSTIDRELDSYLKLWNKMITKEAHASLTEDVNSLIRDYTRKVMRTISASTFTVDRVRTLAETLVKTPNMQKIKENDALTMYVELYILRLLSNS